MKYHTVDSFFQGCKHIAPLYLILGGTKDERARLFTKLREHLPASCKKVVCTDVEHLLKEVSSGSLWEKQRIFFLEEVESLCKKRAPNLEKAFSCMEPGSFLFLGGDKSSAILQELYLKLKQHLLFLDLTAEKIWEHEERLKKYAIEYAEKKKKNISFREVDYLLKKVGPCISALENEIDKLACYLGSRESIALADIDLLCPYGTEEREWKIAEAIIWQATGYHALDDMHSFLAMCGLLRYHLELAILLASRTPYDHIQKLFPKIQPSSLKKYTEKANSHSPYYFQQKMHVLFHYESVAKTGYFAAKTLWSLLYARLVA